jgi:hypothetical protein
MLIMPRCVIFLCIPRTRSIFITHRNQKDPSAKFLNNFEPFSADFIITRTHAHARTHARPYRTRYNVNNFYGKHINSTEVKAPRSLGGSIYNVKKGKKTKIVSLLITPYLIGASF